MVILAIIVVPLLNSFLTAARTNAKAKRVLEATTAGQNLVERIKAQSVEDFVTGGAASGAAITIPLTDGAGNPLTDADGNPYYSYQKTISLDVDGRTYDAVATMSPEKYLDTGAVSGGSINNYNSAQIPQISNMNEKVSAFFIMDENEDQRAAVNMDFAAYDDSEKKGDYIASIKRKIVIDIDKDVVSGVVSVKGTVSYTGNTENSLMPYYNEELYTGDQLENVFICFTPLPDLPGAGYKNETITINNTKNVPIRLYLVKQKKEHGAEDTNPSDFRRDYRVNVVVNEGTKLPEEAAACHVITNLYTGSTPHGSEIQLSYQLNGVVQSDAWTALNLNQDQSLTQKKSTNMIYDIEVKVYPDGKIADGEELATLTGTKTK